MALAAAENRKKILLGNDIKTHFGYINLDLFNEVKAKVFNEDDDLQEWIAQAFEEDFHVYLSFKRKKHVLRARKLVQQYYYRNLTEWLSEHMRIALRKAAIPNG